MDPKPIDGLVVNLFTDPTEARMLNQSNSISVAIDDGSFLKTKEKVGRPRVSIVDAAGVDFTRDNAETVNRKLSASALLLFITQLIAMPKMFWRVLGRTVQGPGPTGMSQRGYLDTAVETADAAWKAALPDHALSILNAITAAKKASEGEKWAKFLELYRLIQGAQSSVKYGVANMVDSIPAYPSIRGLRGLWEAGFYRAPFYIPDLTSIGAASTATTSLTSLSGWGAGGADFSASHAGLSRADACALVVLSGYQPGDFADPESSAGRMLAAVKEGVVVDFSEQSLGRLLSAHAAASKQAGSPEYIPGARSQANILGTVADPNFIQTLNHAIDDISELVDNTTWHDLAPTDLAKTINAPTRYVAAAVGVQNPVSYSDQSIIDLVATLRNVGGKGKEIGGYESPEEGFFPALLAAAPMIGSVLGGLGGGGGGGGGGGLSGLLSKLPIGSMLFGGGKKKEEAPASKGDDNLVMGLLKLLLGGLGKEKGSFIPGEPATWEDNTEKGGLLDFLNPFKKAKKLVKFGASMVGKFKGKRRKKKKKKRSAPPDWEQTSQVEEMYEDEGFDAGDPNRPNPYDQPRRRRRYRDVPPPRDDRYYDDDHDSEDDDLVDYTRARDIDRRAHMADTARAMERELEDEDIIAEVESPLFRDFHGA